MKLRHWMLLAAAFPIAAARHARADFDPFEVSRSAVAYYHLKGRVDMSRMLCGADLVHSGGLPADYIAKIPDKRTRTTLENVCTLVYAGKRLPAASIAYALLSTPEGRAVAKLEDAVETILEMPARGR